jgi:hypothetical protein
VSERGGGIVSAPYTLSCWHPRKLIRECQASKRYTNGMWLHATTQAVRCRGIANRVTYKIMRVGTITVFLVRRVTSLASMFGVANAALFANVNFSTYSRNNGWIQCY